MPIRGITDSARSAFPCIGKLRKGSEATRDTSGKVTKIGQDLSFFRFTSERPEVQAAFEEAYGKQPALINVYLPHPDIDSNFDCWKEAWVGGGMVHRCDGETMYIWLGPDGKYHKAPKPCDGGCKEVGRLSLWIPELVQAGFVGFVTLETHGINDLLSIQGSLRAALEARGNHPDGLRGIQWTLKRIGERISTPSGQNGKRARREKWLVKLEPARAWVALQLETTNRVAMLSAPKGINFETGEMPMTEAEVDADIPSEPPEGIEEADFTDPVIPGPQDEESHKADLRDQIEKIIAERKLKQGGIEQWAVKHCGCSYADLSHGGLLALHEALTAARRG